MIKTVRCKSGLTGWQNKLQAAYEDFDDFESYSSIYGLANRLGYKSAAAAWKANPTVQGSVDPQDYRKVAKSRAKVKDLVRKYLTTNLRTGWFGIPGRPSRDSSKVHLVDALCRPVCGAKMSPKSEFQWSANGIQLGYLECDRCRALAPKLGK